MKIIKDGSASGSVCTEQELQAINAFAKAQLTADEVYAFQVLLCDNEVDRDSASLASFSSARRASATMTGAAKTRSREFTERSLLPKRAKPPRAAKRMSISRALPTCCAPRQTPSLSPRSKAA